MDDAVKLAESLGAETKMLVGNDLPAEILRFAKFENVTQIVIGRSRGGFLAEAVPPLASARAGAPRRGYRDPSGDRTRGAVVLAAATALRWPSLTLVAVSSGPRWRWPPRVAVGRGLAAITPLPNLSMVFLMAVLFSAVSFGIWPAIYASVLSFLAYNFFFIEPLYTFTIAEPHELFALVIFLAVAVMTSALAGRVREQARIAASRMRATRRLYEFTRKLSGLATLDEIAEGAATEINASLGRPTVVLLEQDDDLTLRAAWPPEDALDPASMSAARWAFTHDEPAGVDTATLPIVPWLFLPLRTPRDGSA